MAICTVILGAARLNASTVQFDPNSYTVAENAGSVTLTVTATRTGDPGDIITVHFATADGTAVSGQDYEAQSGDLTFQAGITQQTVTITVDDDNLIEPAENFTVTLSSPVNATLGGSTATVTIADDDSTVSTIQFNPQNYTVNETDGTVTITVVRSGGLGLVTSVDYATADGSATAGADYTSTSGTITFPSSAVDSSGSVQQTFTVPISEDQFLEGAETFTVTLSNPSANAALGGQITATVTIQDEQLATDNTVQFSATTFTASETPGNSIVTLTVNATRRGDPTTLISVQYATSDGDPPNAANAGSDYTADSGSVTFGPGETQKQISITVLDDNQIENAEHFFVTLSNPVGADLLPNTNRATVTIADNDSGTSTIQFSASSYSVNEAGGNATLTVVRSGGIGFAVSATYQTADDTATAGSDYTATSATVSFNSGEVSKDITVPVTQDSNPENTESFTVTLSAPSVNAALGAPTTAAISILDDEPAPVITSPTTATGQQGRPFAYQITADNSPTSFGASGFPSGLTFDSSSGLISGTPNVAGDFSVALSATSPRGVGTSVLQLHVNVPAPSITSPTSATGAEASPFSYQITATNNPTSFGATGLPAGLAVNTATGLISGTPTASGSFTVSLSASNEGGTGTGTLAITIKATPTITSPTSATGKQGQPFNYQITATNNPTSYNATNLPPGLFVNMASGIIGGTPTGPIEVRDVTLTASNSNGLGAPTTLHLTINGADGSTPTPTPTTTPTPTATPSSTPTPSPGTTPTPSPGATPTPTPTPSGSAEEFRNVSTRVRVLTGDRALIGGFIIQGDTPKRVLIRAIGPSLTGSNLSDVLADPTMELRSPTGALLFANDNWKTSSQKQEIADTGFAPTSDLESAIVATLPAGGYTAIVQGVNGATGVGLVEVYDLDSNPATSLVNVSTRGNVSTADNVMIGGFIIGGDAPTKVIVRALGPSLATGNTPVPGRLANPSLELRGSQGDLIFSNDDWVDSPQEQEIRDSTFAPPDNREAAIISTLTPANYTAIVRSADSQDGIGLVEVYRLQ